MKKIIPGLTLISLLALLVVPVIVNAQAMVESCTIRSSDTKGVAGCGAAAGDTCQAVVGASLKYEDCAICCIMDRIYMVTNWIFLVLMALAIIFVLYGGFLIIAAGGSEERVLKGRTFIMWALVGFAIAILAKALPKIAYFFVK